MSRKKAREYAFKCIFQLGFENDYNVEKMLESLEDDEKITEAEKEYVSLNMQGVISNLEDIDNEILKNLKGWTLERISKINLAILRLAIYEIKYCEDIPYKVSVNEAIEIAKVYGDEKSSSFINGLLAKVEK